MWKPSNIYSVLFLALIITADPTRAESGSAAFSFADVIAKAKTIAGKPFSKPGAKIPQFLLDLSYDQWKSIRYNPEKNLWKSEKEPFEVQFFHPGAIFNIPVTINEIENGKVREVKFSKDRFSYGPNNFEEKIPGDLGYAGFRVRYPINRPDNKDEFIVFLGASYFRAIGKNQRYGASARGLAIDTGLESGEKFPFFREFWLVKPDSGDKEMTVYALLDSQDYTGAYRFRIRPGKKTITGVKCSLFRRNDVKKLGIAPVSSMFFYGEETNIRPVDDFRPEIHDSDGLMISLVSGEWLFRPLANPGALTLDIFEVPNVKGFGLRQRDTDFDHYQDIEAEYNERPSIWITPGKKWGKGHVELVQIPAHNEYNDNIVAFWVSDSLPDKDPIEYSYDISWEHPEATQNGGGKVRSTRMSYDAENNIRTFYLDFYGGNLKKIPSGAYPGANISVGENASLTEQQVIRNPFTGGWRLVFKIRTEDKNAIEKVISSKSSRIRIRAFLRQGPDILTETWDYMLSTED